MYLIVIRWWYEILYNYLILPIVFYKSELNIVFVLIRFINIFCRTMSKKIKDSSVKGSRKFPNYILFDGEGNFHRKPVMSILKRTYVAANKNSHLQFEWEASMVNSPRDIKFEKVNHVGDSYLKIEKTGSLPALNFNRKVINQWSLENVRAGETQQGADDWM